jgi:hypothetical protein
MKVNELKKLRNENIIFLNNKLDRLNEAIAKGAPTHDYQGICKTLVKFIEVLNTVILLEENDTA